jgi:hypothetical protein
VRQPETQIKASMLAHGKKKSGSRRKGRNPDSFIGTDDSKIILRSD